MPSFQGLGMILLRRFGCTLGAIGPHWASFGTLWKHLLQFFCITSGPWVISSAYSAVET